MTDREKVAAVVESWRANFEASNAERLKSLWAQDHPVLTYLPTEAELPLTKFADIAAYYDHATTVLRIREWRTWDVVVDVMTPDTAFAWAFTSMAFQAPDAEGHPPGDHYWQGRVSFTMLKRGGEWKIVHYEDSTLMQYMVPVAQSLQRSTVEKAASLIAAGNGDQAIALLQALLQPIAFGALTHINTQPAADPSIQ